MKGILVALSIGILGVGVAFAQEQQEQQDRQFVQFAQMTDIYGSELIGAEVFVTDEEVVALVVESQPEHWESIGQIEDFLLSMEGEFLGVLLDVGQFLETDARMVVIGIEDLRFVKVMEVPEERDPEAEPMVEERGEGEVLIVLTATREELEQAPVYEGRTGMDQLEREPVEPAEPEEPAEAEEPVEPAEPEEPVEAEEPVEEEEPVAEPEVERVPAEEDPRVGVGEPGEEFERVEWTALTVEDLQRAEVYDRFDQRVSGISDILLSADGQQVEAVLIDVGGFLGIGARTVAIDMERLDILYDAQTDDIRVYLDMTEEELEAMPEFQRR